MKLIRILVVFISICLSNFVLAQTSESALKEVVFPNNIDNPLSKVEKEMISEVYAEKMYEQVLNRPNFLKSIKHLLRNRIEIVDIKEKSLANFKKLSSVPLFKEFNNNLKRDLVFNISTFNPLKYQFNFFSRNAEYIHVDNTTLVIKINSQHQ